MIGNWTSSLSLEECGEMTNVGRWVERASKISQSLFIQSHLQMAAASINALPLSVHDTTSYESRLTRRRL